MKTTLILFIINMSGMDFSNVWVTKHLTHNWKLVYREMKSGSGFQVPGPGYNYDLRVQYAKKNYEVWENFDPSVKRITITVLSDKRWQAHYEQ